MKQVKLSVLCTSLIAFMSHHTQAETDFKLGGYVKADVIFSDYSNGAPDSGSLSRQFYVPGAIYGDPSNAHQVVDFQARESRFNLKSSTMIGEHKLTGFIELDFMTHADGNERVSNSYSPRVRQAFLSYDNWSAGQMWTTFQNPGALPENLDFVGAAEGTPFVRQSMVRYTHGNFQFSVENPETTVNSYRTVNQGVEQSQRITSGSGFVPDFVARYNMKTASGMAFTFAGIARQLNVGNDNYDTSAFGYGVSFTGIIPIGEDDLKMSATYGDGLGRYMALNYANAGVLDAKGEIQTIGSYGGYIAYRHWWNDKWRTSVTVSGFEADNDRSLTGGTVNKSAYSGNVNLLFSPVKPLTVGVEYMYAKNTTESGFTGELNRVIFSVKYTL
ncbi:DcaP family trimeric outer membrane transporter [Shewanella sp.]|nr:DcaP family trimeric outer membrane transporter [Shewanella sp.]